MSGGRPWWRRWGRVTCFYWRRVKKVFAVFPLRSQLNILPALNPSFFVFSLMISNQLQLFSLSRVPNMFTKLHSQNNSCHGLFVEGWDVKLRQWGEPVLDVSRRWVLSLVLLCQTSTVAVLWSHTFQGRCPFKFVFSKQNASLFGFTAKKHSTCLGKKTLFVCLLCAI